MPAWPSYARFRVDQFAVQPVSPILRTEMESGPPKQARIASKTMEQRQLTVALDSKTDYLAFRAWLRTDIRWGADWFDFTDPVDGLLKSARIVAGKVEFKPLNSALGLWEGQLTLEFWE